MADSKKKVGRPKKTSNEENAVNEQTGEVLQMDTQELSVQQIANQWKEAFGKITILERYKIKQDKQGGMGATYRKWNDLNPFLQNERVKQLFTQPANISKAALGKYLEDPSHFEPQLRAAAWRNSASQQIYYNMMRRASDIPLYKYYIIPEKLKKKTDYSNEDFLGEYRLVDEWLRTFGVKRNLKTIALQVKREGKEAYLLRNKISGEGKKREVKFAALEKMPTDWIKITGIGQLGYTISFNMMYFLNIANSPHFFGDFIEKAWEDMNDQDIFAKDATTGAVKFDPNKAKDYKFKYGNNVYTTDLEAGAGSTYLFWLKMPFDICYVFASDNSHPWAVPDTIGTLKALQELTDYAQLAGLIASTPLTAILTGEAEFIDNARAGKNETKLSAETIAGFQDIFNAMTSTNIEAVFYPLKNIKLQQLASDVNSSEIIKSATENFIETSGEGGLTIISDKPNVSQVKTAQLLAESAQDYVTRQFEDVLNYIIKHKLGFVYNWRISLWGGIFTFDSERKTLKEQVSGGNVALLPKLLSADDISLLDADAISDFVDSMGLYKKFKTYTQEAQAEAKAKQEGGQPVGRPKIDDADVDNDSTAKDRDNGTNTEGNRENYSAHVCPICGGELEDEELEVCEECFSRLAEKWE